ncbi:hypothetical protein PR048_022861 [Dryococelus australis]|uniref:Uncharacterized protein n=1 Tax=Dryococelus australis TaxID=614101 RepID=A0ABQ9GSJ2_9NEOP|nr:hypothetical protein PR048_022861 [Dryococelus australis]
MQPGLRKLRLSSVMLFRTCFLPLQGWWRAWRPYTLPLAVDWSGSGVIDCFTLTATQASPSPSRQQTHCRSIICLRALSCSTAVITTMEYTVFTVHTPHTGLHATDIRTNNTDTPDQLCQPPTHYGFLFLWVTVCPPGGLEVPLAAGPQQGLLSLPNCLSCDSAAARPGFATCPAFADKDCIPGIQCVRGISSSSLLPRVSSTSPLPFEPFAQPGQCLKDGTALLAQDGFHFSLQKTCDTKAVSLSETAHTGMSWQLNISHSSWITATEDTDDNILTSTHLEYRDAPQRYERQFLILRKNCNSPPYASHVKQHYFGSSALRLGSLTKWVNKGVNFSSQCPDLSSTCSNSLTLLDKTFNLSRGRGGRVVSPLASRQGEPGSIPGLVTRLLHVGIVPDDVVGLRVFSVISRFPPAPSFWRCSIRTSITLIGSQDLTVKSRSYNTSLTRFNLFQRGVCSGPYTTHTVAAVVSLCGLREFPSPDSKEHIAQRSGRPARPGATQTARQSDQQSRGSLTLSVPACGGVRESASEHTTSCSRSFSRSLRRTDMTREHSLGRHNDVGRDTPGADSN